MAFQLGTFYKIMSYIPQNNGWAYYADNTYTDVSPLAVNNARVQLTIDALGPRTETDFLPPSVATFWDVVDSKIIPEKLGDAFDLRIDLTGDPGGIDNYLDLTLDIGDGITPDPLVTRTLKFTRTSETRFFAGFPAEVTAAFLANGGRIYLDSTVSGDSMDFFNFGILIKRDYQEVRVTPN